MAMLLVTAAISVVTINQAASVYAIGTYVSPRPSPQGANACTQSGGNAEVCNTGSYGSPRPNEHSSLANR
jgi:hypothetical protein